MWIPQSRGFRIVFYIRKQITMNNEVEKIIERHRLGYISIRSMKNTAYQGCLTQEQRDNYRLAVDLILCREEAARLRGLGFEV